MERAIKTQQGADYFLGFTWHEDGPEVDGEVTPGDPIDLTGCEARMQIRAKKSTESDLMMTASSEEGDIQVGDTDGSVLIHIPGDKMDGVNKPTAYYDLKIYFPSGEERRVLEGRVNNSLAVTRDDS